MGKGGENQRGFILLPVVFAVTLIAALAFLLGRGGPMALELAAGDTRDTLARRVAEAGMAHAVWRVYRAGCTGYALGDTAFGDHGYSAAFSPTAGSPVDVTVTASLADGATRALTRRSVAIHQAAVSVDLDATADTYLGQNNPSQNFGSGNTLQVNSKLSGANKRAVLYFNLNGIPLGARILSANLSLMLQTSGGIPVPIAARRLTNSWKESEANWTKRLTGVDWTSAGGDMDPAAVSSTSVGTSVGSRYAWDVTDMVAAWVAGGYANNGFILIGADGTANETLYSREEADNTRRPRLSVTYACECGTVCSAPQGTGKVLLVVGNATSPDSNDQYKRAMFESWGYTVTYLDDDDSQANFNTALGGNDAAYVSETVNASTLGNKLLATAKGVVYEKGEQNSVLGLATGFGQTVGTGLDIVDNGHAITQGLATGAQAIYRYAMEGLRATGTLAAGARVLGRWGAEAGLIAVEKGAALNSGSAAGRRVMLPLGRNSKFNPAYLNNTGRLLIQRALDWAKPPADPLAVGLQAHWKLDDGAGTTALDSAGGHHGTMNGATWTTGKLKGALDFHSSTDVVAVPHDATLSLSSFTLSAWINNRSLSGYDVVLNKGASAYQSNYYLGTVSNNLSFGWYNGSFVEFNTAGLNLLTNTWYHIAASFDNASGTVRLYLNGSPVKTQTTALRPTANTTGVTLGRAAWGDLWDGLLDDVRIYDRVLDAAEVAQLAAANGVRLLYVVKSPVALTTQETARQTLMTGWGFTVTLIDDDADQAQFNAAAEANDVAYVSQEALATSLGIKLVGTKIGVVNENRDMIDEFGFAPSANLGGGMPTLKVDTGHYITSGFTNPVSAYGVNDWYQIANTPVAAGIQPVGVWVAAPYTDRPALMALEVGAQLAGGGAAAGRRVQIPMGAGQGAVPVNVNGLTDAGRTIIRRSIEWAGGAGGGGGGGGGGSCSGTLRDEFKTVSYAGSDGTLPWAADWLEINESDGPNAGDEKIVSDLGSNRVQVQDKGGGGEGVMRQANLTGYTAATLSFDYRRVGLDDANDYVTVDVTKDGVTWTELGRLAGPTNDAAYVSVSYDISAYIAASTRIRFLGSPTLGTSDRVFFDNVQIAVSGCAP